MGLGLNTTDLLAAVRREAFLPDTSDQSSTDLLAFADDAMGTLLSATIKPGREGRWLTYLDINIVPGTTRYQLPTRAIAQTSRGIMAVMPDGTTYPLTEIDGLALRAMQLPGATSAPRWYAFEEQYVNLGAVSGDSGWMLRCFYLRSPNKLIAIGNKDSGQIVSFTQGADVVLTLTAAAGSDIGTKEARVDLVSGKEPYGIIAYDARVNANASGLTVHLDTFDTSLLEPVEIQNHAPDFVCAAGTTVYPPIPRALWTALVRATAASALAATASPNAEAMLGRAMEARAEAVRVLLPRDNRRSRAIVGSSSLRRRRWATGR